MRAAADREPTPCLPPATRPEQHPGSATASPSYFPETRETILNNLGQARGAAGEVFFCIYGPIILRFARHAGLAEHDAEDLLATVMRNFVVRVRNGDFRVDRSKGRFRHYLRRVTNHAISEHRRKNARTALDLEQIGEVAERSADRWDDLERQERLLACKERLRATGRISERDLLAFEQYAERNLPADVVSKQLGISISRLYVIKHEVIGQLRRVRRELEEILGEV